MSKTKAKSESVTTGPATATATTLGMAIKEAAESPPDQAPSKSATDMKLESLRMTSVKKAAEIDAQLNLSPPHRHAITRHLLPKPFLFDQVVGVGALRPKPATRPSLNVGRRTT